MDTTSFEEHVAVIDGRIVDRVLVPQNGFGHEDTRPQHPEHDIVGMPNSLFDYVDIDVINVDPAYQRNLNPLRVQRIAEQFDIDVLGVPTLSLRDDGSYWALDGQHRIAGMALAGIRGRIAAHILRDLTPSDEARIYYKTNRHRLNTSAIDAFKARLAFDEPVAVAIKEILDEHELELMGVPSGKMPFGRIMAISEVEQLYGDGLLQPVLGLIRASWVGHENAHKAIYLRGIGSFFSTFSEEFFGEETHPRYQMERMQRLIEVMGRSNPLAVTSLAQFFVKTVGSTPSTAIARSIHQLFNNTLRRQSIRLPEWGPGMTPRRVSE